jgi:hypothetical protein
MSRMRLVATSKLARITGNRKTICFLPPFKFTRFGLTQVTHESNEILSDKFIISYNKDVQLRICKQRHARRPAGVVQAAAVSG